MRYNKQKLSKVIDDQSAKVSATTTKYPHTGYRSTRTRTQQLKPRRNHKTQRQSKHNTNNNQTSSLLRIISIKFKTKKLSITFTNHPHFYFSYRTIFVFVYPWKFFGSDGKRSVQYFVTGLGIHVSKRRWQTPTYKISTGSHIKRCLLL